MAQDDTLWLPEALSEASLVLRVTRACAAGELASELLRSKAAVSRVFARGQLSRVGASLDEPALQYAESALERTSALEAGERVALTFHRGQPVRPSKGAVEVLHRDPVLLVANKPAGILVHGDGSGGDTLTARVQGYLRLRGSQAVPQALQRLDVETTGLVAFSLTEEFQPSLDAQIAGHGMYKRYLAVVEGRLDTRDVWRTIDVPLGRDRHDARRMRASKTGKPSQTRIRTLALGRAESLILAELETGRRHQIRVHLAHLGHPIKGDTLYNKRAVSKGDRSQLMLHAWREQLIHPVTKETLRFEAPAPPAFARLFPEVELP